MFCLSCGKKITENSKFCKYCGISQIEIDNKEKKNSIKDDYETVWTCDFCKEEFKTKEASDGHELECIQNPKNKNFLHNINPKRAWEYLWLTTMLAFFINILIFAKYSEANVDLFNGKFINTLFFSNIGLGIISFLALIVSGNKPKNNKVSMFVKNSLIICFFYLLINSLVFAVEGITAKNDEGYRNKYYAETIPTPVPTMEVKVTPTITSKKTIKVNNTQNTNTKTNTNTNQGSQIDCIGPDGVQFKTTMDECKKLNETWGKPVDYMTNCEYPPECGGGTKYIKYSECKKPCTRINNTGNNPSVYVPQNTTNNNSNKVAVFIPFYGTTRYCPSQNIDAIKSINSTIESKTSEWRSKYNECSDRFGSNSPCWSSCKVAHTDGWNQCTVLYGYTGSTEKDDCTNKVSEAYSSCLSKCPSVSSSCDYVYAEQKNLLSQISNLCK